jgi:N-acetylglucosaminyldiphosphoundecaprenol N-acetyl-beta-D-mannosaminyltransferase
MKRQVNILGAHIDNVTMDETIAQIRSFIRSGEAHQVVTVNLDFLRLAHESTEFRGIINRSDLAVADGMPLVWASRWMGTALPERVTGVALVDRMCELAAREGYSIFLLGGATGVPGAAADVLKARYPGLRVVGAYSPPMGFGADEDQKMVEMIRAAQPDMLFVAFGAPKQDNWIAAHRHELGVPVAVGVGGVFNFLIGRVRRAPNWMQKTGLEWFYRLLQEPTRLWRRYFVMDMPIMFMMVLMVLQSRMLGSAEQIVSTRNGGTLSEMPVSRRSGPRPLVIEPNPTTPSRRAA